MDGFSKLVQACRSYRRFDGAAGMPREVLIDLVDIARQTASGANRMPLRFRVVCAEQERAADSSTSNGRARLKIGTDPYPASALPAIL